MVDYSTVLDSKRALKAAVDRAYSRYARQRNQLAAISCLPPELLSRVVTFMPFATREICLFVCHRWREILYSRCQNDAECTIAICV